MCVCLFRNQQLKTNVTKADHIIMRSHTAVSSVIQNRINDRSVTLRVRRPRQQDVLSASMGDPLHPYQQHGAMSTWTFHITLSAVSCTHVK